MDTIESLLATITTTGIPGAPEISAQSSTSAPFPSYPIHPVDYVVYDHPTESAQGFYPSVVSDRFSERHSEF
jgi:hypothetical protein